MLSNFCKDEMVPKKQEIFETQIKSVFAKFDKDGSGDIDISELQNVCGQLGMELDDDQTAEAMKDLDLNGDGVIDISEFARWYFSGMKSYSNTKRNMFRAFSGIAAFNKAAGNPEILEFVKENPETITQKISLGFNEPDEPETKIN